jgi:hypothetical protein
MPTITALLGADTPCNVEFDYHPRERADAEYPGCDADVTITRVWLDSAPDDDITSDLSPVKIAALETSALEWMHQETAA